MQFDEIVGHAKAAFPFECCGLVGGKFVGSESVSAQSVYPTRNVAANPLASYEAAAADLFAAQKLMRRRQETLIAIYHSHPHHAQAAPSETDLRLAFYAEAVYLIVAVDANLKVDVRGFKLFERERKAQQVALVVED